MSAEHVALDAVLAMREEYRREMACQIVHDSWHARGFTESFVLRHTGDVVGYGSVGGAPGEPRTTIKEFFVRREHRGRALALFDELVDVSAARAIETQTNDVLLTLMLFDRATDIVSQTIVFDDGVTTDHRAPGIEFRHLDATDQATIFAHEVEPVGEWGLDDAGDIVATGGFLTHYNPPYADLYMEVSPSRRRRGLGTYLVQELKRVCRESGRVPAARCHVSNVGSRRTLERAGMSPCARIVRGRIAREMRPDAVRRTP